MASILSFTEASNKFELSISLQKSYTIHIENVELMRIMEIMGKAFYDAVLTTPTNYPTLVPIIKEVSLYWSYDMYLRQGSVKNSVMGAVVLSNDYATNDKQERQNKIDSNLEVAHYKERKLWEHLEDNADDYPLYTSTKKKSTIPNISIKIGDRTNVNY